MSRFQHPFAAARSFGRQALLLAALVTPLTAQEPSRPAADSLALAARYDSVGAALIQGERYRSAIDSLRVAVSLDPARPTAARRLGVAYIELGEFGLALRELGRAHEFDSASAPTKYWTAFAHALRGDEAEARRWAGRLPPTTYGKTHAALLLLYIDAARGGLPAMTGHAEALAASMPDSVYRRLFAGDAALYAGRLEEAAAQYRAALAIAPDARNGPSGHFAATSLALVLRRMRREAEADALLEQSMRLNHARVAEGRDSQGYPYDVASAYAVQGNRREALKWLAKAVDAGWRKRAFTEHDPLLATLRGEREFQRQLRRMTGLTGTAVAQDR